MGDDTHTTPESERHCINCRWKEGNVCKANHAFIHDADAFYFSCDKWGSTDMAEFDEYMRWREIERM